MMDARIRFYQTYDKFKGWDQAGADDTYFDLYRGELQTHGIEPSGQLLEIGFGNGHFLDWAKSKGAQVVGIEVSEQLVTSAKARGLEVYHLPLQKIRDLKSSVEQFDTIVLFDVLEHLHPNEILDLFETIQDLIKDDGKVLCRFPNGLSPFKGQSQYADLTHVTTLTPEAIRQVGAATSFRLVHYTNSFRSLKIGRRSKIAKLLLYFLRDTFEYFIGLLFYGKRVPLDPNLTVSLVKDVYR